LVFGDFLRLTIDMLLITATTTAVTTTDTIMIRVLLEFLLLVLLLERVMVSAKGWAVLV